MKPILVVALNEEQFRLDALGGSMKETQPQIHADKRGWEESLGHIRLLYSHAAADELQLLAKTDPQGAEELAAAALHPAALTMKHLIDADERKSQSG